MSPDSIGSPFRPQSVNVRQADQPEATQMKRGTLDRLQRYGIVATNLLPFSSRGIVFNFIRTPIRVGQSTYRGFESAVKNKSIQAFGSVFTDKMQTYMKRDWSGGITDFYTHLNPSNAEARQIAKDHLPYARFMYQRDLGEAQPLRTADIANKPQLQPIIDRIKDLGFKEDMASGIFFNTETGTCFTLVFDEQKKELVACFQGLGNESRMQSTDPTAVNQTATAAMKSAATDFFGGVNKAALQAMDLGKALKEESEKLGLTPKMVGHSHGGGLAQTAAIANGLEAIVFNSRPMGAGVRRYIGQDKVAKYAEKVVAFSGKGDYLTAFTSLNVLAKVMERLTGIILPRTVGKEYDLPEADTELLTKKNIEQISSLEYRLVQHCAFCEQLEVVSSGNNPYELDLEREAAIMRRRQGMDLYGNPETGR